MKNTIKQILQTAVFMALAASVTANYFLLKQERGILRPIELSALKGE
jgi:hypothetical protein